MICVASSRAAKVDEKRRLKVNSLVVEIMAVTVKYATGLEADAEGVVPFVGAASQNFKGGTTRSRCTGVALSRGFESVHHEDLNDAGFAAILWADECSAGYEMSNEGMFCFLE